MQGIESLVVNNKTYKVQKLGVMDSLYFQAELLHILGASLGEIFDLFIKARGDSSKVDAGAFGAALAQINPDALKKIQPKIFQQVITPENKFLGDAIEVENWFSRDENRGDVWEVLIKAGKILLGEYLPSFVIGEHQKEMTKASD